MNLNKKTSWTSIKDQDPSLMKTVAVPEAKSLKKSMFNWFRSQIQTKFS
jgi:hypothetical protein